jgi:hypothetical protein
MFDSKALREKLRAMFGGGELLEFMKFREAGSAPSDHEIGAALESELFQSEKAFLGIDTINSQEGWVVFAAAPKGKVQLFQRNFEVADGLVTLGKDRLPVVSKYVFEAASESETVPEQEKKEACKCETETKSAESAEEIVMDVKLEERVKALIANEKSGLKETDFEWLSKAGEQAIVLLEKACAEPAPVAAAEPVVETKPEKVTVEVDAAELAELRAMAIEAKQKKQQQKNELVARLKEAQSVYSEAELIEKSIEDLVKLSQVAKVRVETEATDFSGAVPEKRVASSGDGVPQPIDLGARIRERYAKQQNG